MDEVTILSTLLEMKEMLEIIIVFLGIFFVWQVFKMLCSWWNFIF